MKRKVPYAIPNYERLVTNNYYIIDKTMYLEKLEQYDAPVFLRPRRFGKTFLCYMQESYYDIKKAPQFEELFGNTYVGKHPTPEKNKHFVLHLNFSVINISGHTQEKIENEFNIIVNRALESFIRYYKEYFKDIVLTEEENVISRLDNIISYIKNNNLPQMYIIIDEYDNFTNQLVTAGKSSLYKNILSNDALLKTFFKQLKAGLENQTIRRVYLTGVLPITVDDLSSGFNIAKIISLRPEFISMIGFTQEEVNHYLDMIEEDYGFKDLKNSYIKDLLKNYYDGYRFSLEATETLYNSTILTYFLFDFVIYNGKVPSSMIDHNIKTDIHWIKRLTQTEKNTKEMLDKIIYNGELEYNSFIIQDKFNMNTFFDKEFYPASLFHLGMLTLDTQSRMIIPNQTMQTIFMEYYTDIQQIDFTNKYADTMDQFLKDLDIKELFRGYWNVYIKQIPAQVFDKANENFFRTTFYELCRRHLSSRFIFEIEVNNPEGRSDLEILGRPETEYKNIKFLIEFKHFTKKQATLKEPRQQDIEQINRVSGAIKNKYPDYDMRKYLIYTFSSKNWDAFKID